MKTIYGHDKTIHRTEHLDVEQDSDGNVVAVWFRCCSLPFEVSKSDSTRAVELAATDGGKPRLLAVEIEWP